MDVCRPSAPRKLPLLFLTFLWGLSGVLAQLQMPQTSIDVIKGQMVILRAFYSWDTSADLNTHTIIWNFFSNKSQLIISYTKGSIGVGSSQFQGRTGFLSNMPSRDVTLYVNNTQESDSGRYLCQVIIPGDSGFTAELSLDVKVPPSAPKCSLSGKPVLKGNVTLTCKSSSGKPVPLYKWNKTSPTSMVFFSPMLNEKTGDLRLTNLTSGMSGKYVCTASNAAGSNSCFINLEVVTSTNAGMIAGATIGTLVGCALILLICGFFVMKRQRDNEDDMANEIKEDAQAPKRVSWAKSGMGSDIISKNGTLSSIASSPQHREPSLHQNNHHHHHLQHYPQRPPSDTTSIVTATGSTAGYRPSRHHGASTPTHYGYNNNSTLPHGQPVPSEASANGGSVPRPERHTPLPQAQAVPQTYSQPQRPVQAAPTPPPLPSSAITSSNIVRMGGVPIMVPAQNQAGSLV